MSKKIKPSLETANEEERDFILFKTTHDLKAPLASIMGVTYLAQEEVTDPAALEYFLMIEKSTIKMDSTIGELIEFAKIKKAVKNITPIDFRLLLVEILDSLKHIPNYQKINFKVSVQTKNAFYSDKILLTAILQNLIDNTIKYRREKIKSFVKIKVNEEKNGVAIVVEDNGIGIDKKFQQEIFNMFVRGSVRSSGSGLGLYIVKNALKKLNGKIELESELNQGTTFIFYIPNEIPHS